MNGMILKILTPVDNVIIQNVTSVILPAEDGQYCIQYNHLPLAIYLIEGQVTAVHDGIRENIRISETGFAFIKNNVICVFADEIHRN